MTSKPHLALAAAGLLALLAAPSTPSAFAQQPAAQSSAPPRQSGTVKAITPQDLVLTLASGQDVAVTLPSGVRVLLVDPQTRDIKNAQAGTVADIAGGDKAIITGTAGDTGQTMTATRVYLLKSGAIAAMHASEEAAWAHSVGGVVKTAAGGTLTVANGARTYTITTTPSTVVRRYAAGSVRFEDAQKSDIASIHPGDQVQARGQREGEAASVAADEIVAGSFSNFSGTLSAVDAAGGTVTLRDLATKKPVTVALTSQTNLRRLPAGFGQGAAARGGEGAGQNAESTPPAGQGRAQGGQGGAQAGQGGAQAGQGGARRLDLSRVLSRLPEQSATDLKPGEAVMIVASNGAGDSRPTAITLLTGVEQILASSPAGQTTLSPWSLGGGSEGEGGEGGGGGGAAGGSGPSAH